jgi:hypothetical protein
MTHWRPHHPHLELPLNKNTLSVACILALSMTAGTAAHAAATVYFGENQSPAGLVAGDPVTARTQFLSSLSGVSSEGFEAYSLFDPAPLTLTFAGSGGSALNATLAGDGFVESRTGVGRFNTTSGGSKWWDVGGAFTLNFATAISAFGFYGTDVGDFNGQVTIDLLDTTGAHTLYTVANTVNGNNGALLFWGFVDSAKAYTQISFGNTSGTNVDFFGFDDMVIGDIRQVCTTNCGTVPEPTSLALVGLGLFAAGMTARKARRA